MHTTRDEEKGDHLSSSPGSKFSPNAVLATLVRLLLSRSYSSALIILPRSARNALSGLLSALVSRFLLEQEASGSLTNPSPFSRSGGHWNGNLLLVRCRCVSPSLRVERVP